jgi:L-asparaginase II
MLPQMHAAEMLWVDIHGVDLKGQTITGAAETRRFEFPRPALDELDVLSLITMAAQESWEAERSYTPTMPELASRTDA